MGDPVTGLRPDRSGRDSQRKRRELLGLRTDYTPLDVFYKREQRSMRRGDKLLFHEFTIVVPFDADFDRLAATVAHALRSKIVYRTDGGRFARGLVRSSDELRALHAGLTALGTVHTGDSINLNVSMIRRRDPQAKRRHVMIIFFNMPEMSFTDPGPLPIDPAVVTQGQKNWMNQVLVNAAIAANGFDGDRGDCVRRLIRFAEDLDYPANWDLWYYSSAAVFKYVQFHTNDAERKRMTAPTGGKLPFDGWTGTEEWRTYPFRFAADQCQGRTADDCLVPVSNALIAAEREMRTTFHEISQQMARGSAIPSSSATTRADQHLGDAAHAFLNHVADLQKDKSSLYSAFLECK